jgi:YD repeat-containing protein
MRHQSGCVDWRVSTVNRLTSAVTKNSTGSTTASYSYAYDGAANMTSRTINSTTRTFGYNAANQLTSRSDTTATFSYDANGNETTAHSGLSTPARRATTYTQAEQAASFTVGSGTAIPAGLRRQRLRRTGPQRQHHLPPRPGQRHHRHQHRALPARAQRHHRSDAPR